MQFAKTRTENNKRKVVDRHHRNFIQPWNFAFNKNSDASAHLIPKDHQIKPSPPPQQP